MYAPRKETSIKHIIDNCYHEICSSDLQLLKHEGKLSGFTVVMGTKMQSQRKIIKDLCDKIRYKDEQGDEHGDKILSYSFGHKENDFVITCEQLVGCCSAYLEENHDEINGAFFDSIDRKKNDDFDLQYVVARLKNIFEKWSKTALKGLDRNKSNKKGVPKYKRYTFASTFVLYNDNNNTLNQTAYFIDSHYRHNIDLKLQILKDRGENFSEDLQSEIEERRAELEQRIKDIEEEKRLCKQFAALLGEKEKKGCRKIDKFFEKK